MTAADKFAGLRIDESLEGGFMVRGTEDLDLALQFYVDRARDGEVCIDVQRAYLESDLGMAAPSPSTLAEDISWAGWHLRTVRANMRVAWFRKIHCLPSSYGFGEYTWMLHELSDGDNKRGAFRAVVFYE